MTVNELKELLEQADGESVVIVCAGFGNWYNVVPPRTPDGELLTDFDGDTVYIETELHSFAVPI